jgi:hypothetical protein
MADAPPVQQIILTVNAANGRVIDVQGVGNVSRRTNPDINPGDPDLYAANLKHVGVMFHQHKNPDCFYFQYLNSIWEICF